MYLHTYGKTTSEKFANIHIRVRRFILFLVFIRKEKSNEVLWLVTFLDNDEEYFKSRFKHFMIMESVPCKDAIHKIVHIVRNIYFEEVENK